MSKYTSTVKLIINGVQYSLHRHILNDMPFFEDFVKDANQTEFKIDVDVNFDNEIMEKFIDYLYCMKNYTSSNSLYDNIINNYEFFKAADFFCITIQNHSFARHKIQYLYNYCYNKQEVDMFKKFIDFNKLPIDICIFIDNFDVAAINKLIKSIDIWDAVYCHDKLTEKQFSDLLRHCNVTFNNKYALDYKQYKIILNFLKEDNKNIELNKKIIYTFFCRSDIELLKRHNELVTENDALEYLYKKYC